jgi:hypothetical protein
MAKKLPKVSPNYFSVISPSRTAAIILATGHTVILVNEEK